MMSKVPLLLLASAVLAGCASVPDRTVAPPAMSAWTAPSGSEAEPVMLDWWTAFGDQALNGLVERALARNADLRSADASLRAAWALAGEARAARLPTGQVEAAAGRGRVAALSQPPIPGTPDRFPTQTLANLGGALGWELDLFGRVEASIAAANAQAKETLWLRRQTEAAVSAAVVRAYLDHRHATAGQALVRERIEALEEVLSSVKQAAALGAASQVQIETITASLAQARGELPGLTAQARNAARRIAVLSGDPPSPEMTSKPWSAAPQTISAGDPVGMLRRRPDVAAAEQRFAVAAAETRIAVADLYPRVTLTGNIGLTAKPDELDHVGALGFSAGPSLTWGLFDLPRLRSRVAAADARSEAAQARWEATALAALEEADSALETWNGRRQAARLAEAAAAADARKLELANVRERAGHLSRRELLQAKAEAIGSRLAAAQAEADEAQAWVAAQLALGAGWREAAAPGPRLGDR